MSSKNYFLLTDFLSEIQAKKIFGVDTAIIAITNANNPLHCFNLLKDSKGLSESTIILIDALLLNSGLKAQLGVDVLKWLRIKGYRQHVVVYSAYPLQTLLLHKPENIILCSPGVTYLQIPFGLQAISFNSLSEMPKGIDLKPFLKPCFSIEDYRHQHANWWGVKRMCDIHRVFKCNDLSFGGNYYPHYVIEQLNSLNNAIGNYLYDKENSLKLLKEYSVKVQEKEKENFETLLSHYENNSGNIIFTRSSSSSKFKDVLNKDEKIVESVVELADFTNISEKVKILYVDDQAEHGWLELLNTLITMDNGSTIRSISLSEIENIIKFIDEDKVADCINLMKSNNEFDFNLILLDIRLSKNESDSVDFNSFSGIKLLNFIRKHISESIPVVLFTASNKIWSLEQTLKCGADGYWIKEGVDNFWSIEESLHNYNKLCSLIQNATWQNNQTNKYEVYEILCKTVDSIQRYEGQFWWENDEWASNDTLKNIVKSEPNILKLKIRREQILSLLVDAKYLFKQYLVFNTMELLSFRAYGDKSFIKSIFLLLFQCVEVIHHLKHLISSFTLSELARIRDDKYLLGNDNPANNLIAIRNKTLHHSKDSLSMSDLKRIITLFNKYLVR